MCDTVESNHGHRIYILILCCTQKYIAFRQRVCVCVYGCRMVNRFVDWNRVYVSVLVYVYVLCTLFIKLNLYSLLFCLFHCTLLFLEWFSVGCINFKCKSNMQRLVVGCRHHYHCRRNVVWFLSTFGFSSQN